MAFDGTKQVRCGINLESKRWHKMVLHRTDKCNRDYLIVGIALGVILTFAASNQGFDNE